MHTGVLGRIDSADWIESYDDVTDAVGLSLDLAKDDVSFLEAWTQRKEDVHVFIKTSTADVASGKFDDAIRALSEYDVRVHPPGAFNAPDPDFAASFDTFTRLKSGGVEIVADYHCASPHADTPTGADAVGFIVRCELKTRGSFEEILSPHYGQFDEPKMISSVGCADDAARDDWIAEAFAVMASTFTDLTAALWEVSGKFKMSDDSIVSWRKRLPQRHLKKFPVKRKTWVSAYFKNDGMFATEKQWKVTFDTVQVYRPVDSVGFKYIDTHGKQLQIVLEFSKYDLFKIADGKADDDVRRLAKDIAKGGKEVWIRPLHEFNSDWYPWSIYPFTKDRIAAFKNAWRRIVKVFREEKAPVKFQLCYINSNVNENPTPWSSMYPGDDVVDMVGTDVYSRNDGSLSKKLRRSYGDLLSFGKPIFIGEVACRKGTDKVAWYTDAWDALANDFTRITVINFFLINKDVNRQWQLETQAEVNAFVNGYRKFEKVTGN